MRQKDLVIGDREGCVGKFLTETYEIKSEKHKKMQQANLLNCCCMKAQEHAGNSANN
jgi:hypothetical protein